MNKILIGYDLNKRTRPEQYENLIKKIQTNFPTYWHCLDSTWIVVTSLTPVQVVNLLSPTLDANDELLAVDITGKAAAWIGFDNDCSSWLKNNL